MLLNTVPAAFHEGHEDCDVEVLRGLLDRQATAARPSLATSVPPGELVVLLSRGLDALALHLAEQVSVLRHIAATQLDARDVFRFRPTVELETRDLERIAWGRVGDAHVLLEGALVAAQALSSQDRGIVSISAASGVGKTAVLASLARSKTARFLPLLLRANKEAVADEVDLTNPFKALLHNVNELQSEDRTFLLERSNAGKGLVFLLLCSYLRWVRLVLGFTDDVLSQRFELSDLHTSRLEPLVVPLLSDARRKSPATILCDVAIRCMWNGDCDQFVEAGFSSIIREVGSLTAFSDVSALQLCLNTEVMRLGELLASRGVKRTLLIALDEFAGLRIGKTHVFARIDHAEVEASAEKASLGIRNSLLLGVSRVLDDIRVSTIPCSLAILGSNYSTGPRLLNDLSCFRAKTLRFFFHLRLLTVDDFLSVLNQLVPDGGTRLDASDERLRDSLALFSGRPLLFFRTLFGSITAQVLEQVASAGFSFADIVVDKANRVASTELKEYCSEIIDKVLSRDITAGNEKARNMIPSILWDAVCGAPLWSDEDWVAARGAGRDTATTSTAADPSSNVTSWAIRIGLIPIPLPALDRRRTSILAFEEPAILRAAEDRFFAGEPWDGVDLAVVGAVGSIGAAYEPATLGFKFEAFVAAHLARTVRRHARSTEGCPLSVILADFLLTPSLSSAAAGTSSPALRAEASAVASAMEPLGPTTRLDGFKCYATRIFNVSRSFAMLSKAEVGQGPAAMRDLPLLFWDVAGRRPRVDTIFFDWSSAQGGPDLLFWVEDRITPGSMPLFCTGGDDAFAPTPPTLASETSRGTTRRKSASEWESSPTSLPEAGRGVAAGGGGGALGGRGRSLSITKLVPRPPRADGGVGAGVASASAARSLPRLSREPARGRALLDTLSYREHRHLFEGEVRRWRLVAIQLKNTDGLNVAVSVASLELPLLFAKKEEKRDHRPSERALWRNFVAAANETGLRLALETPLRFVLGRADLEGASELRTWSERSWRAGSSPLTFLSASNETLERTSGSRMFNRRDGETVENIPDAEHRFASVVTFAELGV